MGVVYIPHIPYTLQYLLLHIRVLSYIVVKKEIHELLSYKTNELFTGQDKPLLDEMVLRSQSARDFYPFSDEEIEM